MAATKENKRRLELSCREARLILKLIPLDKTGKEMKKEEISTVGHYLYCTPCRDRGLAELLDAKLSCQEAILVWAESAQAIWHKCAPLPVIMTENLREIYAVEHVWGKYQWRNSMGGSGWDSTSACPERACHALNRYWHAVPMSSHYDGASGVINLFPFLIYLFIKQEWPLDPLFAVQKKRLEALISDLRNGKITVSAGHYHSLDELMEEFRKHIAILQNLPTDF